jgi:transposase-like protein
MYNELWQFNLSQVAYILATLAFAAVAWLYFDLHRQTQEKGYNSLLKSLGFGALAVSFVFLAFTADIKALDFAQLFLLSVLQAAGISAAAFAFWREDVPGLPGLSKPLTQPKQLVWILPFAGAGLSLLSGASLALQLYYRVKVGLSKEYKLLLLSALALLPHFGFSLLLSLALEFPSFFEATAYGGVLWFIDKLALVVAGVAAFLWVRKFLQFRVTAQLLTTVWQLVVLSSLTLATIFAQVAAYSTEQQVVSLLERNNSLVQYNFEQIEVANASFLQTLASTSELKQLVAKKDFTGLQVLLAKLLKTNTASDRVLLHNSSAIRLYNTDLPGESGESDSDNKVLQTAITTQKEARGFETGRVGLESELAAIQVSVPVVVGNGEVYVLSSQKSLSDNLLAVVKEQTSQELSVYIDSQRSASTLVAADGESKQLNVNQFPANTLSRARILGVDYFVNTLDLEAESKEIVLLLATPQYLSLQASIANQKLIFIVALVLAAAASLPSAWVAKSLSRMH